MRKSRAVTEKLYIREIECISDNHKKFKVLGSTGNMYDVNINQNPTCSCPDFKMRHVRCKHIFYVFHKILGIDKQYEDNVKYSEKELNIMFGIKNNTVTCDKVEREHNKDNEDDLYIIIEDYSI